jgi:hypothetical protein
MHTYKLFKSGEFGYFLIVCVCVCVSFFIIISIKHTNKPAAIAFCMKKNQRTRVIIIYEVILNVIA